jgi:hypothetical protein
MGGNGKGMLNELMRFMMGDYGMNADCSIGLGNQKSIGNHGRNKRKAKNNISVVNKNDWW